MEEPLYRFMLAFDGEPQDVGFLQGLDEVDIPYDRANFLLDMFETLPAPILETPDGGLVECWFTEKGVCAYADAINAIIKELLPVNWQVLVRSMKDDMNHAIYCDEFQAAYSSLYLETDKTLYREIDKVDVGVDGRISLSFHEPSGGPFKTMDIRRVGEIFHVGTMDISLKSRFSHEGNGLSISNCPEAWRQITKGSTHGDTFQLIKPDMKFLDFYSLTHEEIEAIESWAIDAGYVKPAELYQSISWDEEGAEYYSLYDTYEEALYEAGIDKDRVRPCTGLLPTDKLLSYSMVKVELLDIPSIISELYAEKVLDYDGVYWDEELEISAYSAPRGVIFNSKLSTFEVTNLTKESKSLDSMIASANAKPDSAAFRQCLNQIAGEGLIHGV